MFLPFVLALTSLSGPFYAGAAIDVALSVCQVFEFQLAKPDRLPASLMRFEKFRIALAK
jgi:hypothetical protein